MKRFPLSTGLVTLSVLLFALWTVLCNLAVWWRLSLDTVIAAFGLAFLALITLEIRRRRRGSTPWLARIETEPAMDTAAVAPSQSTLDGPGASSRLAPRTTILRLILAALGAAVAVMVFAQTQQPGAFAATGLVVLGAALASTFFRAKGSSSPSGSRSSSPVRALVRRRDDLLLLLAGLALVVITLAANHPDKDDCFYGNVAARAAGAPGQPFLQHDEIFGIEDMPVILPGYRVHAYEPLAAAVSRLTGIAPLLSLHWVLSSLAALLAPFAWSLLLRRIFPRHWLLATFISLALLLTMGDGHASYANYAFIRLHQGKGVLLTVALPLVAAFAMEYAESPTWPRAVMLWAVQTAAVGLSFSALLTAPAVAWIVLLGSWRQRWNHRLLLGFLCSLHPVLLAVVLTGPMHRNALALAHFKDMGDPGRSAFAVLDHAMKLVLGQGRMRLVALFFLLFAWSVPPGRRARRVLILLPIVFLALFNPITVGLLATDPTSREVWFRAFWILPLPAMVAIGLSTPAILFSRWKSAQVISSLALAAWLIVSTHAASPFSDANHTTWTWPPRVKAPPLDYEAARCLVANVDEGTHIVAPEDVAAWVPTFKKRVYPLFTRFHDERFLLLSLDPSEVYKRRTLTGFVSGAGSHLNFPEVICFNSQNFGIGGWCLREFGTQTDTAVSEAADCGFHRTGVNSRYRVYTRHEKESAPQP